MKKLTLVLVMLFASLGLLLAQRTITGKVSDEKGEAIVGANVLAKGTSVGAATDVDGNYRIAVPAGSNVLVFSYIGYTDEEVSLGASNVVDIRLQENAKVLTDVVVTALGVKRDKKSLGYSISTVSNEEITGTRNVSALDALNGKVAGLQISTASGAPGASTVVNIRGFNSVTGSNEPLFVVDGVPMNNRGNGGSGKIVNSTDDFNRSVDFGNQMNDINPNDIETISVLKGSSASSLYGSRAANGVILITTKKGLAGKPKIDFSTSMAMSSVLRVPHLQNKYGQGWSGLFQYEENGSWGPEADNQTRLWGNRVDNSQQLKAFSIQKNNLKDFFDRGTESNTSLSISGGNDFATYRASYGYTNGDGVVPTDNDSYKRHSFALFGGLKYKKLSISSSMNYVNKDAKAVATGQGDDAGGGKVIWQEIIQIPRDHSIVDYSKYRDATRADAKFYDLDNYFTPYAQNPYWTLDNQGNYYKENRFFGNFNVGYDILSNLKLNFVLGGDVSSGAQTDFGNLGRISPGSPNSSANNVFGALSEVKRNNNQFNADLYLNHNLTISDNFDWTTVLGVNANERTATTQISRITNLDLPGFYNLTNSSIQPYTRNSFSQRRLMGSYLETTLGFNHWAYLTLGGRFDKTSTLPAGNNGYFYPKAALALNLNEAIALGSNFDVLKLRAGYGQTGNDTDPYLTNPVFTSGVSRAGGFGNIRFPFAGINSYEQANNPGNSGLKPERTNELELGFESSLFKRRLRLDFAWYDKVTKDQIIDLSLDPSSGYTTQTVNLGKVSNKGIEVLLNIVPVRTKDFEWGIGFNFNKINNKVLELGFNDKTSLRLNSSYLVELKAEVGKPLGALYAPDVARDPSGNIIVNPVTGLPTLASTKTYMGSILPDYTMGLNTYVTYKKFTLQANGDYRSGGNFYSYTARLNYFVGNAYNTQYNDRQPWIIPNSVVANGDGTYAENTTAISRANVFTYYGANDPYQKNHVLDRTFFKLRNVSISYNIPLKKGNRVGISDLKLSAFGRNLILWTPKENHFVDPEANTFGTDLKSMYGEFSSGPSTSVYGLGLNCSF